MNENGLESTGNFDAVNAWDMPGAGQTDNKVYAKTLPGQIASTETVVEPVAAIPEAPIITAEPFIAPAVDFTAPMPRVDKPIATPIEVGSDAPAFVAPAIDFTMAIPTTTEPIQPATNDFAMPQVDIPVNNNFPSEPVNEVSIAEVPNSFAMPQVETPINNNFPSEPINEVPVAEVPNSFAMPATEAPMNNNFPNQQMVTPLTQPVDIQPMSGVPLEEEMQLNQQQAEIKAMNTVDLNNNFGELIDNSGVNAVQSDFPGATGPIKLDTVDTSNEQTEAYDDRSGNTFSNIFDAPIDPAVEVISTPDVPATEQITTENRKEHFDSTVRSAADYRTNKRKYLPPGAAMSGIIFAVLLFFVLFIDKISLYVNNFVYEIFH